MVGLGPGARSYTRALHYSTEYAVGQGGVKKIIEDYHARPAATQAQAVWGVALSEREQKRRYVIKSLLRAEGLSLAAYQARFGTTVLEDLSELSELSELRLMTEEAGTLKLTAEGLAWSDTIGPWLYSEAMTARMSGYSLA
jgi:oxygen-independent coproporphyrinogen-3 oxidase